MNISDLASKAEKVAENKEVKKVVEEVVEQVEKHVKSGDLEKLAKNIPGIKK